LSGAKGRQKKRAKSCPGRQKEVFLKWKKNLFSSEMIHLGVTARRENLCFASTGEKISVIPVIQSVSIWAIGTVLFGGMFQL